jgi:hypothetical protein
MLTGRHLGLSDLLQVSLPALETDPDDQCSGEEFQGGEKENQGDWKISG